MTFDERLAALGVDPAIKSLHEDRCDALYEKFYKASEATAQELGLGFSALALTMVTLLLREIAERDDIIDRMETRLDNVIGQLNYLKHSECRMCMPFDQSLKRKCGECVVYKGMSDDWPIDNGYKHPEKFEAYEQELAYEQETGKELFSWLRTWPKSI